MACVVRYPLKGRVTPTLGEGLNEGGWGLTVCGTNVVEGRFARRHLYDGAAKRPDVCRLSMTSYTLVYDLWSHVLYRS